MARLFEKRGVTVVPEDMFRKSMYGVSTPTGLSITPESAMTVTAFFAAVRFRAFSVASLPKILYQRVQEGNKRRAVEKKLYNILHDQPNPEMTSFDFWATLDSHVMVRGNAYAEIVFDKKGNITALWPLRPDKMDLVRTESGELIYQYQLPNKFNNQKIKLLPEQVFHLRGLSTDGIMGIAPITQMRNAVALAKATEEFGGAFFGNGAQPGMVLKHPGRLSDQGVVDRIKDSWEQSHQGLSNSHRVAILEEGMDVAKIGLSPEDSQFLETRVHQVYEISRMTDVPPQMIFELSQANFSTLEQMTLDYVVHHLRPWLISYEQQSNRSLLLQNEKDSGFFIENLMDGLLRGDLATRYSAYSIGRQNGWLSLNDIRRMENMNSIGAKGDKYVVPLNMSVLGEDGMPLPVPDANGGNPNTPARALAPLFRDAAERIGKREQNEISTALKKYDGKQEKYRAWVEEFYKRNYPEFIYRVLKPFIDAGILDKEKTLRSFAYYCDQRGEMAVGGEPEIFSVDEISGLFEEYDDGKE